MKNAVYHLLVGTMAGDVRRTPAERFALSVASAVNGHRSFADYMTACATGYGRSHTPASLQADVQDLLLTDLNPTTQTVRYLAHTSNVVFGYGIYQGLDFLHPGFSTEIARWVRQNPASHSMSASVPAHSLTPPDIDQPALAREATASLLTEIVVSAAQPSGVFMPTTLTGVAQHLGVASSAAAEVGSCLETAQAHDLAGVARLVGASTRTLQRQLKAEHTSFEQLRCAARMVCAMHALQTTDRVTDIAHTCGYADSAHFSHSFRAACGMPPQIAKLLLRGPVQLES